MAARHRRIDVLLRFDIEFALVLWSIAAFMANHCDSLLFKVFKTSLEQISNLDVVVGQAVADDDRTVGATKRLLRLVPYSGNVRIAIVLEMGGRDHDRLEL